MSAPQKIALEDARRSMRIFLDFPRAESDMRENVEKMLARMMLSETQNGGRPPLDALDDYLNAGGETERRLQFIIGLSGGALERMKRIYAAMFPGIPWGAIKADSDVRRRVAAFLIDPRSAEVFVPPFVADSFTLPHNWIHLLRDETFMRPIAANLLQPRYATAIGAALEDSIRAIVSACGCESEKGAVAVVDDKEVDVAVPNLDAPRVLIMSSYQLTTASAQSSKANEQARMYQDIQTENRRRRQRRRPEILFVNVIDGGGCWRVHAIWKRCGGNATIAFLIILSAAWRTSCVIMRAERRGGRHSVLPPENCYNFRMKKGHCRGN